MWAGYPSSKPYVDPKTGDPPKGFENQCAIKVSVALHAARVELNSLRAARVIVGGKPARFMVLLAFLGGCAASVGLWAFWTPRCNEACPQWLALSMMAFSVVFPLLCASTAAVVAAHRHAPGKRWTLPVLVTIASVVAVAFLTQAAR